MVEMNALSKELYGTLTLQLMNMFSLKKNML
jgi:hypothetical protein